MEPNRGNASEAPQAIAERTVSGARGGWLRIFAVFLFGIALGAGGLWLALRAQGWAPRIDEAGVTESSTSAASKPLYHCPMHPAITSDHPSNCPICGMKLVLVTPEQQQQPSAAGASAASKPLYHCPMHPTITSDHPSDCPICGMKLVLVTPEQQQQPSAADAPAGRMTVSIDPARQQMIGLRTAAVTRGEVGGTWRTVGRVAVDPTRVRKTHVKVDGYVERVFVNFVGQPVEKGEPLFTLYSPTLLVAQSEYLVATQSGASALQAAARRKLELWDVPAQAIDALEKTGPVKTLTVYSPIRGTVTAKNVVEGSYLQPGADTYEITDLGMVWVMVDAYESDLGRVRVGIEATMTLPAYPDRVFSGRVKFIAPLLDANTRTLKVHLHFANPTGELKPELFGEVMLRGDTREGLRIPLDAVIHSGTRAVVFVAEAEGKFRPVEVLLGKRLDDQIEVVSGLSEDMQVVTRANFLVDSESQLRASLAELAGR